MSAAFKLEREQWVPPPLDEVFAFFADARNLEVLTPPWLRFRIRTPEPIKMSSGTRIEYHINWHGVPLRWKTEIARWEPPFRFEDMQIKGPYRVWHHTHQFKSMMEGTQISDVVHYALPFGIVGRLVHAISVRRNLEQIFDYRRKKIRELFGGEEEKSSGAK
ncbi:MAG: SRPBCC family protein [Acidobacteriaceae bacterium]